MDVRTYLTASSIIGILYALGFLLIPGTLPAQFGAPTEPYVTLNLQYCGAALLAWAIIAWFARDFQDWNAVRGVLIGSAVSDAVLTVLNLWATFQHLLNSLSWCSTIVTVVPLAWALLCLSSGARKPA